MPANIGRLISILYRSSRLYLSDVLAPFGLTSAEHPFLLYLYHHDGATQDEMASHLLIDKGAAARAISRLEGKGFLTRRKDARDKRCKQACLTDHAWQQKDAIQSAVHSWAKSVTVDLDQTDIEALDKALQQMAQKAEKINEQRRLQA